MIAQVAFLAMIAPAEPATQPAGLSPVCHDAATTVAALNSSDDWQKYFDDSLRRAAQYQAAGNYRLAMDLICPLREEARSRGPRPFMLASAAMGRALCFTVSHHDVVGDPAVYLNESLAIACELNDEAAEAAVLNDLANLHAARGESDQAREMYDRSAKLAEELGDAMLLARVRCNAMISGAGPHNRRGAIDARVAAKEAIDKLPPSIEQGRMYLTLAIDEDEHDARGEEHFRRAIDLAKQFEDDQLAGFAWGYLGRHYEQLEQYDQAMIATRRARFAAQKTQRDDTLYRWEWQLGRLHLSKGDTDAALAAYERAIRSIGNNDVRNDVALAYAAPVSRGNFRREVGQLYYSMADLLLRQADTAPDPQAQQALLSRARDAIELFKAVELTNYFQDDCLKLAEANKNDIDAALQDDPQTAVVYVIPLADRIEVLVSFAGEDGSRQPQLWRAQPIAHTDAQLTETALEFRSLATDAAFFDNPAAERLYDWLIKPIDSELQRRRISTLVFVPDGELRSVAFAALRDRSRKRYLVEDYAIAITPGLSLSTPMLPTDASREVRILAGGLSQAKTLNVGGEAVNFPALAGVPRELDDVAAVYGSKRTTTLENDRFLKANVSRALDDNAYPVVHLATHAKFNADVRKTFVVTQDEQPLDMNQLERLIQPSQFRGRPVELLSLSACETAEGSDGRAALGLAGVAIRAGARSALGTLWLADDETAATLIPIFYRELNSSPFISKSEAMRRAQVQLIKSPYKNHPRFWAPFVIVGNWR